MKKKFRKNPSSLYFFVENVINRFFKRNEKFEGKIKNYVKQKLKKR